MQHRGKKVIKTLSLALLLALIHCAKEDVPVTTEFQAKLNDSEKVKNAAGFFQLGSKFKPIQYQLFDSQGVFSKNNIVARYRDQGAKTDFNIKFRFPYDPAMITVLTQCFVDQKIEINRYSDHTQDIVELTFRQEIKKEDIGMSPEQTLSQNQIRYYFGNLQNHMKDQITQLTAEHPEFSEIKAHLEQTVQKHFENVSQKIKLVAQTNVSTWKNTSSFQRDRWTVKPWKNYQEVVVEVTHTTNPIMEISTRVDGDIKDQSFFHELRLSGLHI